MMMCRFFFAVKLLITVKKSRQLPQVSHKQKHSEGVNYEGLMILIKSSAYARTQQGNKPSKKIVFKNCFRGGSGTLQRNDN